MPNRKYQARFPPARIKKIMRTDKEVGKVAASVPVVISRALELFAEELIRQAGLVTMSRGSRTLSPAHLKHCVFGVRRFDFLHDVVASVTDVDQLTGEDAQAVAPHRRSQPPLERNGQREGDSEVNGERETISESNGQRDGNFVTTAPPPSIVLETSGTAGPSGPMDAASHVPAGPMDSAAPVGGLGFYQPIASGASVLSGGAVSACPASSRSHLPSSQLPAPSVSAVPVSGVSPAFSVHYLAQPGSLGAAQRQ